MKKFLPNLALLALLVASSCSKNLETNTGSNLNAPTPGDSVIAPMSFNFSTTETVSLNVKLATNNDVAIAGVPVKFYAGDPQTTSPVYTGLTDANGAIIGSVNLPQYVDTLTIDPEYVGLMRNAKVLISNNSVIATIGGSNSHSSNVLADGFVAAPTKQSLRGVNSLLGSKTAYSYMGSYDSYGVPDYLEPKKDVISSQLLSFINASLPERIQLPVSHPSYLKTGNVTSLNITALADVWITFVSEGAGYTNTLGYYTYPTNNKPTSLSDIDTIHYIYPNASLPNSGGNLQSGSKVRIGRFTAGTSVGFVILANGWNGSSVTSSSAKYYSDPILNPETDPSLQQHTVLLNDAADGLFVVGFEDQNRQSSGCDHDFNDLVVYATSNPVTAISTDNVQDIDTPADTDKDGVSDKFDQFPTDPTRAYINYYPSETTYGTLAFEDLWPTTGDYDMNDLVVNYRYKYITNAKSNVVEMYSDYVVKAAGASFLNGFGVQFPFSPSDVKIVTGQKQISNYIKSNSNGTEASQSKAVVIPFDNYQALIKRPNGFFINTQTPAPAETSDTAHIYMSFVSPLSPSSFGTAPFNPFVISNLRRNYEVHLAGYQPTDLANAKLFGTAQDYSQPLMGIYYKSKNSWPWGLNFAESFDYSSEGNAISKSYNYFLQWAQSGGTSHQDWYKNLPGNRNSTYIYKK